MASDAGARTVPRFPTPYPDVNAVVLHFLEGARRVLGERFRGMYLSGSLALGDFDPRRSDIDFVVVTDDGVPADLLSGLQEMHARFNAGDSPWATEVEAVYISEQALRRYDPAQARHPHIQRGATEVLELDQLASDWALQRYILRKHGVIVAGPPPRTLINPVAPRAMRRAVVALMGEWWGAMPDNPARLRRPGYQAYATLTMCRMLYTLATGGVVSKPVAARWAQKTLDARWTALIERALAWRKDQQHPPREEDVSETLDLIRYTMERCRRADLQDYSPGAQ